MAHGIDIERLASCGMGQLRELWRGQVGRKNARKSAPKIRSLLARELAWQVQQSVHGGLDAQARGLLNSAIRRMGSEAVDGNIPRTTRKRSPRRKSPHLQAGAKLIRTWRGKTYEVLVGHNGKQFHFRGEAYRSLTPIAQKITGAHWSGPRFFGLHCVRAAR